MLNNDLEELYDIQAFQLNEQVKRNLNRVSSGFYVPTNGEEWKSLTLQIE